jgi:transposase
VIACRKVGDRMQELMDEVITSPGNTPNTQILRDMSLLQFFSGIGRIVAASFLAEAARPLQQRDYQAIRAHGGIAPVTRRSGKTKQVGMRIAVTRGSATRSITGRAPACRTTLRAGSITPDSERPAAVMAAHSRGC